MHDETQTLGKGSRHYTSGEDYLAWRHVFTCQATAISTRADVLHFRLTLVTTVFDCEQLIHGPDQLF